MPKKQKKKRDGWFFTRNLLDEINRVVETEKLPQKDQDLPKGTQLKAESQNQKQNMEEINGSEKETGMTQEHSSVKEIAQVAQDQEEVDVNGDSMHSIKSKIQKLYDENRHLKEKQEQLSQVNRDFIEKQKNFPVQHNN